MATTSSISSIIDDVLAYRGYNIDDLAEHASFEEVVYLLWNGHLPDKRQLEELKTDLAENGTIPEPVLDQIKTVSTKEVNPMSVLRTAVSLLALYDEDNMDTESNYHKAIRLQAKISSIVTAFTRIRDGKKPISPNPDFGFAENFLYMLNGEKPDETSTEAFNKALVLHADHELNASTFTSRVCVATLSDVYSGITAAIGTLKGPLHGGANERVIKMLFEIGEIEKVDAFLQHAFEKKQKIMGFGHRVYKSEDPRAKHLREMSRQLSNLTGEHKWYEISLKMEEAVRREKGLPPNVDFYSASVYHSLGIPHDIFTPIFAVSRVSGWLAHILEQYDNNRLIRPRADYIGYKNRAYVQIEDR